MQQEGRIRDHVFTNGAWRDSLLFAVLEQEWSTAPHDSRPDHATQYNAPDGSITKTSTPVAGPPHDRPGSIRRQPI
jgi:hypothetical protein